ncbi:hypothetical protein [Candidatus Tisiphia endosymbiont of Micropterix aruncella]|uniref:hypothetical protein n=1 Tax=Candidatus Tisiphia endosymbiont of Micropterix aruncella TaxID=3066271 RepID=UPI003AA89AAA
MKIRDFVKDRIILAEELVQYREFKTDVSVVSITDNTVTAKRIQKFILHNTSVRDKI